MTSQVQFGNVFIPTVQPGVANPDLKWEQSATHNAGLDFGVGGSDEGWGQGLVILTALRNLLPLLDGDEPSDES